MMSDIYNAKFEKPTRENYSLKTYDIPGKYRKLNYDRSSAKAVVQ